MNQLTIDYVDKIEQLLKNGDNVDNGTKELLNQTFEVNPKQPVILSPERKVSPYYLAGELLWYLMGSNSTKQIAYYSKFWNKISDDGVTNRSAYGYRMFNKFEDNLGTGVDFNQFYKVIETLEADPNSRQAIISLYLPHNKQTKDEICTLNLQFFIRNDALHMIVNMRSNDIILGTANDIFMFSIIQQILAVKLGVEVGKYYHNAASLHLYERHFKMAKSIVIQAMNDDLKWKSTMYQYDDADTEINITEVFVSELNDICDLEKYIRTSDEQIKVLAEKVLNRMSKLQDKFSQSLVATLLLYRCKQEDNNVYDMVYSNINHILHPLFHILIINN